MATGLDDHSPGRSARSNSRGDARGGPEPPTRVTSLTLKNPLDGMTVEEMQHDVNRFVDTWDLTDYREVFQKGALLAKHHKAPGDSAANINELSEEEKEAVRYESAHKWRASPRLLYLLCALCAGCAIVQGMDQTVINGAQEFYFAEFHITDPVMQGFLNGSPYAAAALLGCWLNAPLNKYFGRRGTIFISCAISALTGILQAGARTWHDFLVARLLLGIAVGAKSSTTPVYVAEAAPKDIRGALTMMWQMWTAFGIMLGYAAALALQNVDFMGANTQWRWMMGLTSVPPLIVGGLVFLLPDSPRWYMDKGDYGRAFRSMRKLRAHQLLAARDLYLAYKYLEIDRGSRNGRNMFRDFFTVRRNWRAAQSAWFCMFMQQFCGVNIIAYYSTKIFTDAGFSRETALLASFGCGAVNWLGAFPAVLTIDRLGRRYLLLITLPALASCLFWAGSGFAIQNNNNNNDSNLRTSVVVASIYIFMLLYSPGLGPVPFTYSAEAFPLHIRALGMASATAVTWALNFLISFSWPKMVEVMTPTGGFYWYAGWNVVGFVFVYFFVPETKGRTLEELDGVFSMRNRDHARYYLKKLVWGVRKLTGGKVKPLPPLYDNSSPELKEGEEEENKEQQPGNNKAAAERVETV